ncbi:thiamine phosphate synthase [Parabacteroides sp. FAFU027]|uniref:thiamine phosphate synthase n=1 Tax=Parabacteroides sp. FAFU027 TaxID=2922715 RepID=UPI001FAFC7A5|nr:thiamine phosphate synthase [Parabacteroides sp. FAFU027]
MQDFGLYIIITKPELSYEEIAKICVRQNIRMIQLREKHLTDREIIEAGKRIKSITAGTNTLLVINDRVDLALAAGADVLHLGQDDLPIEEARKIAGDRLKIGLSTHSIEQVREALTHKPDYIGFGPVYPTNAKARPDAPVGVGMLKEVLSFADVPVVAIGGIFPENLDDVVAAGAKNVALVRHFMQTTETEQRIVEIKKSLTGAKQLSLF